MAALAPSFGGGLYDWQNRRVTIDTPENLAALTYLSDFRENIGRDKILRFEMGKIKGYQAAGSEWAFMSGAYSIAIDGEWKVEQMRKYAPDMEYGTAHFPPPKGGKKLAAKTKRSYLLIPKGATNVENA